MKKYAYYIENEEQGFVRQEFMGVPGEYIFWMRYDGTGRWHKVNDDKGYVHPKELGYEYTEYTGFDDPNFILDQL